jgi:hypothetical protein
MTPDDTGSRGGKWWVVGSPVAIEVAIAVALAAAIAVA